MGGANIYFDLVDWCFSTYLYAKAAKLLIPITEKLFPFETFKALAKDIVFLTPLKLPGPQPTHNELKL